MENAVKNTYQVMYASPHENVVVQQVTKTEDELKHDIAVLGEYGCQVVQVMIVAGGQQ